MHEITPLPSVFQPRIPTRERTPDRQAFFALSALLFIVTSAATVAWSNSMSAMPGMAMPGGWTMSMMWMRMPGESWAGAMTSFIAMWMVMMAAMMTPSLVPMLLRHRQVLVSTCATRPGPLATLSALGYFFIWTLFGFIIYPTGVAIAGLEMQQPAVARAVPIVAAFIVLIAAAIQFTNWKLHHLNCCREAPDHGRALPADAGSAWLQGMRFGLRCGLSCANLTAVLLVLGVMDLRAMAAVTAAITAERLAPTPYQASRTIGFVVAALGLFLMLRAAALL